MKLLDKMLNVVDEMPDNFVRQVNLLKNVTGGGMMSGKHLYQDSITFRSYAKFIFSSNKPAIFLDKGGHGDALEMLTYTDSPFTE